LFIEFLGLPQILSLFFAKKEALFVLQLRRVELENHLAETLKQALDFIISPSDYLGTIEYSQSMVEKPLIFEEVPVFRQLLSVLAESLGEAGGVALRDSRSLVQKFELSFFESSKEF